METIKTCIAKLVNKENLSGEESNKVMDDIMSGDCAPSQIGSFLTALRMKGETVEEISAFASVMRDKSVKIKTDNCENLIDTCGTGGDCKGTFNISTITAFVIAAAGAKVAKHGNRSASGKCGSADVLEELGINLDVSPEKVSECIDKIGIGFLFAPKLHGAMKHAIGPRKEIGIRTVFNILGPLTNPAGAAHQLLGVYDSSLTEKMANVLKSLGAKRALVVHGKDGLDEITITGKTKVSELKDNNILTYDINPTDLNISIASPDDLKGGDSAENAKIALDILNGNKGPKRDIVIINSAAALYAAGITEDIKQGVEKASLAIDSGKAMEKLNQLKELTND